MKLVKKWLFPILTCLIVAGAVVLPPYISYIRDNRQSYAQIHTSELDADGLLIWEGWDLLERLELFARWYTDYSELLPSFQTVPGDEESENAELAALTLNRALDCLIQAGVLPDYLLKFPLEHPHITRVLFSDPDRLGMGILEPLVFWEVWGDLGEDSLYMIVDSESGLPLILNLFDPNLGQWLSHKDPGTLPNLAQRYFDLFGLMYEPVETDLSSDTDPWQRYFVVEGTEIQFCFTFTYSMLDIKFGVAGLYTPE